MGTPPRAQLPGIGVITQQPFNGIDQCSLISGVKQNAIHPLNHHIQWAACARGHDRQSRRHRFENHVAKRFVGGGKDKDISSRIGTCQVVAVQVTCEHSLRASEVLFQGGTGWSIAHDRQTSCRYRLQYWTKPFDTLFQRETAHEEQQRRIRVAVAEPHPPRMGTMAWMKALCINPSTPNLDASKPMSPELGLGGIRWTEVEIRLVVNPPQACPKRLAQESEPPLLGESRYICVIRSNDRHTLTTRLLEPGEPQRDRIQEMYHIGPKGVQMLRHIGEGRNQLKLGVKWERVSREANNRSPGTVSWSTGRGEHKTRMALLS